MRALAPMSDPVKIDKVTVRAVGCMGASDSQKGTVKVKEGEAADKPGWTHVKMQILEFVAVEMVKSRVSGQLQPDFVTIKEPGIRILDAKISIPSAGLEDLRLSPISRGVGKVSEVVFEKGEIAFPCEAILTGSYKSPQDDKPLDMKPCEFYISSPQEPAEGAGCCVIA